MNTNLVKIVDYLLLHSPRMREIGLFHGKLGIAMALFMYSSQYHEHLTGEFAWELLQQVYEGIHEDMPMGLADGLAGIGYGIVLLNKFGLVECDLNDILYDVDQKIMEHAPRRIVDLSCLSGLGGISLYLKTRQESGDKISTFDSAYLEELQNVTSKCLIRNVNLMDLISEPLFSVSDYIDKPLCIDGGSSYYLINSYFHA